MVPRFLNSQKSGFVNPLPKFCNLPDYNVLRKFYFKDFWGREGTIRAGHAFGYDLPERQTPRQMWTSGGHVQKITGGDVDIRTHGKPWGTRQIKATFANVAF